jgi:hypothetical protein
MNKSHNIVAAPTDIVINAFGFAGSPAVNK